MHGLVSLTAAADLLAEAGDQVERSSLSRYVTKHADALNPQKQGRETVVEFELLAAHRRENIRLASTLSPKPFAPTQTRADEAAANLRAQRRLRELDLGQREGDLTLRAEVEDAAHSSIIAMKGAFSLALNDTADSLAALTGTEARLIRPHLRTFVKAGFEQFTKALAAYGLEGAEPELSE